MNPVEIPNLKNFLSSDARPPDESEYVSIPSMLCKEEVNRKLDFILHHIYRFSQEYCITEEQTITFIQKRYYQLHYMESSYQINLDCFIEPTKQRDLNGKQVISHRIIERYHRKKEI